MKLTCEALLVALTEASTKSPIFSSNPDHLRSGGLRRQEASLVETSDDDLSKKGNCFNVDSPWAELSRLLLP